MSKPIIPPNPWGTESELLIERGSYYHKAIFRLGPICKTFDYYLKQPDASAFAHNMYALGHVFKTLRDRLPLKFIKTSQRNGFQGPILVAGPASNTSANLTLNYDGSQLTYIREHDTRSWQPPYDKEKVRDLLTFCHQEFSRDTEQTSLSEKVWPVNLEAYTSSWNAAHPEIEFVKEGPLNYTAQYRPASASSGYRSKDGKIELGYDTVAGKPSFTLHGQIPAPQLALIQELITHITTPLKKPQTLETPQFEITDVDIGLELV